MFTRLNIYIAQDNRQGYTFHPKVYNFESPVCARLFIGSSNLTKNGFRSNYEVIAALNIDLRNSENSEYIKFLKSINAYFVCNNKGWVQELSYDLLFSLKKEGWFKKETKEENVTAYSELFGKGTTKAAPIGVKFKKIPRRKIKQPQIALQLTNWDTDPRHSETQIPKEVINNGFFPKDDITLLFSNRIEKYAKLSHYKFHSRIYNKEIINMLNPKKGDILVITRISPEKFGIKLIKKKKISPNLLSKLTEKRGKGKNGAGYNKV